MMQQSVLYDAIKTVYMIDAKNYVNDTTKRCGVYKMQKNKPVYNTI